ncbi:DUF5668 domain-containing protein [Virgibacillus sp. 179-BFC.A HS]|uniref:DUF5668 domain-containing protein n=1 Tax=Tigheibacillus jepli TaxID=3035914 RepID=A0ABU5CHX1_9BACI|nr:DUF5668 domain-containing protein [Virgibacillus sp. 179-BFC.A HS]MDY0405432.1 DUF5668 domain-containing protein [Virgibacillus sp. 179-BFC.A HS]
MKKNHALAGYFLIGIGAYFLLKQLHVPILTDFYTWPTLLMIIGIVFLLYSHSSKDYQHLFTGTLLLGLGLHFHGLKNYSFWPHHWAMYLLIVGIAFLARALKTKSGYLPGILLCVISLPLILSWQLPLWFQPVYHVLELLEIYWPVLLIIIGIYILIRKK